MKSLIFLSIIFLLSFTSAYYVERALPEDSIDDFWITYNVHSNESFSVSLNDKISGGCSFEDGSSTLTLNLNNKNVQITQIESATVLHKSFLVKRNNVIECEFSGRYNYNNQNKSFKNEKIIFNQDAPNRIAKCSPDESLCNLRTEDYSACINNQFVFLGHVDKKCGYKERFREPGVKWFSRILDWFKLWEWGK